MRKIYAFLLVIVSLISLTGCIGRNNNLIKIIGDDEVFIGEEIILNINDNNNNYSWHTEEPEIPIISNGKVTCISKGQVNIYVENNGEITAEHLIIVKSYIPEKVEIINVLDSYEVGSTYQLKAVEYPDYSKQEFI